jgi:hypothetical protein
VEPEACSNAGKEPFVFSVPLATPEVSLRVLVISDAVGCVLTDDEFLLLLFEDEVVVRFKLLSAL